MELRHYAHLLRRRALLLSVAAVVGLSAGVLVTNRTKVYQAEASVYVGSRQFAAVLNSPDASAAMDRLTQTFAAMINSTAVAADAIQLAHVPRTARQVMAATTAAAVPNTNYIVLFVTDTDPAYAQALANGEADALVAEVQSLEPGAGGRGPDAATSVVAPAARPAAPQPTATKRHVALGFLLGLGGGVALVGLLNYLDVGVDTPQRVEMAAGIPLLGTIPTLPPAVASLAGRE